ncbi:hypothetical protein AAFF_G00003470 [Aldrovandia affinis]|uniref:Uncharacterized protein n=1 Tax=Aldrovandia affinis TaxID=143900 RepID=A0AAD7TF01_9TELE|nr:hypothetical protein AAFF_G00003470 [Aldrovandia affinis]
MHLDLIKIPLPLPAPSSSPQIILLARFNCTDCRSNPGALQSSFKGSVSSLLSDNKQPSFSGNLHWLLESGEMLRSALQMLVLEDEDELGIMIPRAPLSHWASGESQTGPEPP